MLWNHSHVFVYFFIFLYFYRKFWEFYYFWFLPAKRNHATMQLDGAVVLRWIYPSVFHVHRRNKIHTCVYIHNNNLNTTDFFLYTTLCIELPNNFKWCTGTGTICLPSLDKLPDIIQKLHTHVSDVFFFFFTRYITIIFPSLFLILFIFSSILGIKLNFSNYQRDLTFLYIVQEFFSQ